MNLTLRPFSASDYPTLTALYNRCRPDAPITEAFLRHFDATHEDDLLVNLLAERRGETGDLEVARRLVGAVWAFRDQPGEPQVHLDVLLHPAEDANALALKLQAAHYAKAQGGRVIVTQNHTTNRPMLGLNETLGFVRQPAWITLKKVL